jgi:hypothetical protein
MAGAVTTYDQGRGLSAEKDRQLASRSAAGQVTRQLQRQCVRPLAHQSRPGRERRGWRHYPQQVAQVEHFGIQAARHISDRGDTPHGHKTSRICDFCRSRPRSLAWRSASTSRASVARRGWPVNDSRNRCWNQSSSASLKFQPNRGRAASMSCQCARRKTVRTVRGVADPLIAN